MTESLVISGIKLDTDDLLRGILRSEKEIARLERQLEKAGRAGSTGSAGLGAFKSEILGIAAALGAFTIINRATANLDRFAHFVFGTNVELQKLEAQMKTVTGTTARADAAFHLITEFARTTPFEISNITTAFVDLRARGVVPTEERLRGLGNLSSGFSRDITDLTQAIISGAGGMARPLKAFGVDMEISGNRATVSFQGVRKEINLTVEELSGFLAEQGNSGRLSGAMAEQMKTLGGAIANTKDSAALFAKAIGDQGLNVELVDLIHFLDDSIRESDDFAEAIGSTAAAAVDIFTSALEISLPRLQQFAKLMAFLAGGTGDLGGNAMLRDIEKITDPFKAFDTEQGLRRALGAARLHQSEVSTRAEQAGVTTGPVGRLGRSLRFLPGGSAIASRFGAGPGAGDLAQQVIEANKVVDNLERAVAAAHMKGAQLVDPDTGDPGGEPRGGGDSDRAKKLANLVRAMQEEKVAAGLGERALLAYQLAQLGAGAATRNFVLATYDEIQALDKLNARREENRKAVDQTVGGLEDERVQLVTTEEQYLAITLATADADAATIQYALDLQRQNKALSETRTVLDQIRGLERGRVATADHDREQKRVTEAETDLKRLQAGAMTITTSVEDALIGLMTVTEGVGPAFKRMAQEVLQEMARLAAARFITQPLFNFFLQLLGGGGGPFTAGGVQDVSGGLHSVGTVTRATGGPLESGQMALVGERGPELFRAGQSGSISPLGGSGGSGVAVTVIVNNQMLDGAAADEAATRIARKVQALVPDAVLAAVSSVPHFRRRAGMR